MTSAIVVDDDQDAADTLTTLLEFEKIQVVGKGNNGKECVELYNKHRPDVTLLDLNMPQYDGKYAIDEIKKKDPYANIIVVSGFPEQFHIGEHEVTAVFRKPYKIKDLIDVINSCKKVESKKPVMLCADCGCLPSECRESLSPKKCPNCTFEECCCWQVIKVKSI